LIHTHIYICIYTCIYTNMHADVAIATRVRVYHTYVRKCTNTRIHSYTHSPCTHGNTLQHTAQRCSTKQIYKYSYTDTHTYEHAQTHTDTYIVNRDVRTATHSNTLHSTATHCNTLHPTSTHCNSMNTLQDTSTHYKAMQHKIET